MTAGKMVIMWFKAVFQKVSCVEYFFNRAMSFRYLYDIPVSKNVRVRLPSRSRVLVIHLGQFHLWRIVERVVQDIRVKDT